MSIESVMLSKYLILCRPLLLLPSIFPSIRVFSNNVTLHISQFSRSVMSDSLGPHGLQHARLPCPSPIPGAYSNSCLSCWWCHLTISFSAALFSFCLQSFLASGFFPMSRLFASIRWPKYWSFSFSISPSDEYSGLISFRIGWFDLRAVEGTLKSLLQHHSSKALILWCSAFFMVQLSWPSCKWNPSFLDFLEMLCCFQELPYLPFEPVQAGHHWPECCQPP